MAESLKDKTITTLKGILSKIGNPSDKEYQMADGLIRVINSDRIKSDKVLQEYLAVNRSLFEKNIPGFSTHKWWDDFKSIAYTEPNWGVERDILKESKRPDLLERWPNISTTELQEIAKKLNMSYSKLVHQLGQMKTAKEREYIAKGGELKDILNPDKWTETPWNGIIENPIVQNPFFKNLAGGLLGLLSPRVRESIAMGEEPSLKDYTLDAGQNVVYSLPAGRLVGGLSKGAGLATGAAKIVLPAITAPVAVNISDANAYDEDRERGTFDPVATTVGAGVNLVAPEVIKGVIGKAGQLIGKEGVGKAYEMLGSGSTAGEFKSKLKKASKEYVDDIVKMKSSPWNVSTSRQLEIKQNPGLLEIFENSKIDKTKYSDLGKVINSKGTNFGEKYANSKVKTPIYELWTEYQKIDPKLRISMEGKTAGQLAGEEAVKNFTTNEARQMLGGGKITELPFVGKDIAEMKKEEADEEQRRKAKEKAEKLYGGYGLDFMLGDY